MISNGTTLYFAALGSTQIVHTTIASPTLANGAAIHIVTGTVGITNRIGSVTTGAHLVFGAPSFASPFANDYHLQVASAAIDVGVKAGVFNDFEGQPRPQGLGFNMGYDESPFAPFNIHLLLVLR